MVRACLVAGLTVVVLAVGLMPRADAGNNTPDGLRLGVLKSMFRDVSPVILDAVARPFADLFHKQTGLNGSVEMCGDCDALATKMKDKSLHFGVFHGFEFAWVRDRYPELQPLVVTIPPGRKVQACLVVHKDAKALAPADLKGACVACPLGTKAHCQLFFDRLQEGLPANCCRRANGEPMVPEEVLDAVAAEKMPAALVDVASLTAYETNKPGAYNQLRVMSRSEAFPPAVIAYRKGAVSPELVERIREGLVKANETAQGRAFMVLWKLKGFEDVPANFDAEMRRIAKAYPQAGGTDPK